MRIWKENWLMRAAKTKKGIKYIFIYILNLLNFPTQFVLFKTMFKQYSKSLTSFSNTKYTDSVRNYYCVLALMKNFVIHNNLNGCEAKQITLHTDLTHASICHLFLKY